MTMTMPVDDRPKRTLPERIGRYQVVERIGRGAMGVVYRAHDSAMGRDVALKVLTADLEDDPDIRTRFHREAEAAARLSHPNIITIFDVGEDADRFFIVMELLRGLTLREFLKQGDVTLARKLDLMSQLCAGLGSAHNASIYHRDIKPGNIFVRGDGILKILDFGVARLASSSMTAAGFVVGTPDYMSPEQARGENVDGRSDIFSLGGVFYFMLTGRKPFPATELPSLFNQIQHDDPVRLLDTEAPPELAAVIARALAKNVDARYQSCQDLQDDIDAVRFQHPAAMHRTKPGDGVASDRGPIEADGATHIEERAVPDFAAVTRLGSSDDTVDSLPVGMFSTDDTVTLKAPSTWLQRVTARIDSTVSGAFARMWRPTAQNPPAPTGARKR